jgi:hypothetical protein
LGQIGRGDRDGEAALHESSEAAADAAGAAAENAPEFLLINHFKPHVGKIVRFRGTRHAFPLDRIISDRKRLPDWVKRRPFTLIFRGPREREVLPEGLYHCEIENGPTYAIHVSPIHTPWPDRQEYQAVFN